MLTLGPGSTCDICFERFSADRKAPCSIPCGHVFCSGCVKHVKRLCPLCRTPFDKNSWVKLHIDLDHVNPPVMPEPEKSICSEAVAKEAQRLLGAIGTVADMGTSETGLRDLVNECRVFLHGQPHELHRNLRVAHRMLAFLGDVRTRLRDRTQDLEVLEEQITSLKAEKEQLERQIARVEHERRCEKDLALDVEATLREHNNKINQAYLNALELYNTVAREREHLTDQIERDKDHRHGRDGKTKPFVSSVDKKALQGTAIQDPTSSFLISPLPQFTSLPSVAGSFAPLPDLDEDDESESEESEEEEEEEEEQKEEEVETSTITHQQTVEHKRPQRKAPPTIHVESLPSRPVEAISQLSGLSRTAPYRDHRRPRSSSSPSQPSSRNQSPASSNPGSPASPLPRTLRQSPSSREIHPATRSAAPEAMRTRLHDILRSPPSAPSSMPNIASGHFPPSLTSRERDRDVPNGSMEARTAPGPSSSDHYEPPLPAPSPSSSNEGIARSVAPHPQATVPKVGQSPTPHPYPPRIGVSSASDQAKKIEEERRRKMREERQERQAERERAEAEAAEKEREVHRSRLTPTVASSSASQAAVQRDLSSSASHASLGISSMNSSTALRMGHSATSTNTAIYGRPGAPPVQAHMQEYNSGSQTWYSGGGVPPSNQPPSRPLFSSKPTGIYV